uniref:Solute carrier family 22 member 8-like n=1 Tax=Sinocyclocheilus grahami TaxID=75366 RepID=A0A672RF71_SINGR
MNTDGAFRRENIASKSLNQTVDTNIFNISTSWTSNHSELTRQSLECHEANRFAHGQATYMTGLLIGSVFGGAVSDKYGKKLLLICCSAVHAVATVVVAFLPYVPVYLTSRGISGAACCAIHICTYSLGVEWSLPKYRIWPPTLFSFIFSLGMMGLPAIAFLASGWMQFHLALGIPQILFLPLYFFLPESPRWLLLNKRMKTLEGYQNRSPEDKHYLSLLLDSVDNEIQKPLSEKTSTKTESNFANFTSPTILLRLFIMSYIGQKCLGLVSLCYRVACIINAVATPDGRIPLPAMICYSSGPIIGAALCLLLPETSGIPLPDTVQDCEKQPRLKLPCCACWPTKPKQESDASFTKEKNMKNQAESSPLSA